MARKKITKTQKKKTNKKTFLSCSHADGTNTNENGSTNNTTNSTTNRSNEAGWLKKMFGSNDPNANLQPGFVPMKSDFNVPTDGLPATTIKSRKSGRTIR